MPLSHALNNNTLLHLHLPMTLISRHFVLFLTMLWSRSTVLLSALVPVIAVPRHQSPLQDALLDVPSYISAEAPYVLFIRAEDL